MQENTPVILLSDAGPLITLAYADALDTLLLPGWRVEMVDMVAHEVTRNETPTSQKIADWLAEHKLTVLKTSVYERYMQALDRGETPRKSNLGELAVQEVMTNFAIDLPETSGVFVLKQTRFNKKRVLKLSQQSTNTVVSLSRDSNSFSSSRFSMQFILHSELSCFSFFFADFTLERPMVFSVWMICRCKLERSTTSSSIKVNLPMPEVAKYIATGEPSPPNPTITT
mgnify:CR=1 FL=1